MIFALLPRFVRCDVKQHFCCLAATPTLKIDNTQQKKPVKDYEHKTITKFWQWKKRWN